MPAAITFPNSEPQYAWDRDCLVFPALVGGEPVQCFVSAELLFSRFGAGDFTEEEMRKAYRDHREEIQTIARAHIENGWIDEDRRVFLTTRFTRLTVTFGQGLEAIPDGHRAVTAAHRTLTDIIGPGAEGVNVDWDAQVDPSTSPKVSLKISDPTTGRAITGSFEAHELVNSTMFRLALAGLWNFILRERSRRLNLQAG